MKKKLRLGTLAVFIVFIAFAAYWLFPRTVELNTEGFKYRLGKENIAFGESLQVNVNGKAYRRLGGNLKFIGEIQLEGKDTPVEQNRWQVELLIHQKDGELLYVRRDGKMLPETIGTLFVNRDFSEMTIAVMEKNEDGNGGGWSGGDGLMISAPATNREAALAVSNFLMADYLKGLDTFDLE
jgi:hypothetical protein